jgi:hypothetical protein
MGAEAAHLHLVRNPLVNKAEPDPLVIKAEPLEAASPPQRRSQRLQWWWLDVALLAAAGMLLMSSWYRGDSLHRRRASCSAFLVMVVYAIPTIAHGDPVALSCPHTRAVVSGMMALGVVYAVWSLYQQTRSREHHDAAVDSTASEEDDGEDDELDIRE